VALSGGGVKRERRFASSSSDTSTSILSRFASMEMRSPSSTSAIGPPSWASGVTCPTMKPWEPPENRPSVINATCSPMPAPMMADVGVSISGIPGPPLGPS
jgi:hypothetical protein